MELNGIGVFLWKSFSGTFSPPLDDEIFAIESNEIGTCYFPQINKRYQYIDAIKNYIRLLSLSLFLPSLLLVI